MELQIGLAEFAIARRASVVEDLLVKWEGVSGQFRSASKHASRGAQCGCAQAAPARFERQSVLLIWINESVAVL